jgi:hypothetical protein
MVREKQRVNMAVKRPSAGRNDPDKKIINDMVRTDHKWTFRAHFRRHAFGWRSQPAIIQIKKAVSEINRAAREDPIRGAEGAVLFIEKVSAALEQVDSSSGAIGTAVNNAIDTLAPIIAAAPAGEALRKEWLDRLWQAVE